ncbi:MAG: alpha/beta fold hydrolase [Lachnospiraceae bacterium]|nr:alpha/beta fold hydrolase [Lachnospiraceae bacterium]
MPKENPMKQMKKKLYMDKYVCSGKHWSELKFYDHMMTDALIKHILGLSRYGMSDAGEVFEVMGMMKSPAEKDWALAWGSMAERLMQNAKKSEGNKKIVSASSAYLRAASYYRFALASFSDAGDPIIEDYSKKSISCYRKYLELSDYPGEVIEIPYGETKLSGYFYKSPVAGEKAPLMILTPGRDTLGEDTVWVYDEALKRGIHCIVMEGPGQGAVLRLQKIPFIKEWERIITPIIDYAYTLDCIDKDRIALMGISFGGYLVPRAAAFEKRIRLCIANPGNISWGRSIGSALEMAKKMPKALRPPMVESLVRDYAWKHGVENDLDAVINELKRYDNSDILDKLTCKMLVMDATADVNPGEAMKFYEAINCPKEYMLFDDDTMGQTHTQMGCYASASERLFDWIEENL